jgi:hypothetical protein
MVRISRHNSHYVYGAIQSNITCSITAAVASLPFLAEGSFMLRWLSSWLCACLVALPIALLAAPVIRRLTDLLTYQETGAHVDTASN